MVAGEPRQAQWLEVSENCESVALWVRWAHVDTTKPVYSDQQKLAHAVNFSGLLRLNNASTAEKIIRSARSDVVTRTGTKDVAYLRFLACRPEFQGQGFGTGVLAKGLARCDELGIPAYLETATARNEGMYQRRQFEVEKRYRFGQGEHIRVMLHRPSAK
jgi:GNAT superfamily N-acetyltransferase